MSNSKTSYNNLPKEALDVIKPPVWSPWYYVNTLLRKAYENTVPGVLKEYPDANVLDYGCGSKPYEYLFEQGVKKYTAVDIGDNPLADIQITPGEKLPFGSGEFDIILSSQVLEHVQEVDQYMAECNRVLKTGGTLLLSTHGTWQFHAAPYDFNRWTIMGLKHLMNKSGFEVLNSIPVLGQLALTSQLRITFYNSFAERIGIAGKLLLFPVSLLYQLKMMLEDFITPDRVKQRDSAVFLLTAKKKKDL